MLSLIDKPRCTSFPFNQSRSLPNVLKIKTDEVPKQTQNYSRKTFKNVNFLCCFFSANSITAGTVERCFANVVLINSVHFPDITQIIAFQFASSATKFSRNLNEMQHYTQTENGF